MLPERRVLGATCARAGATGPPVLSTISLTNVRDIGHVHNDSLGFTGIHWELLGIHRGLLGFARIRWGLPGSTTIYRDLLGFADND